MPAVLEKAHEKVTANKHKSAAFTPPAVKTHSGTTVVSADTESQNELRTHVHPLPAKASGVPDVSSTDKVLSLFDRKIDLLFSMWFFIFLFSVTFTDLHNFTASVYGVTIPQLEHMDLPYPPKFLTKLYFEWARTVDPLLYANPLFWQVMEWVNLLCLMPTSILYIFAFFYGWNSLRLPMVITSSFTFYSLLICIGCTLFGDSPSPNPSVFLGLYVPYLVFPIWTIWRVWQEKPFSTKMGNCNSALLTAAILGTLTVYFIYTLKWFMTYHPENFDAQTLKMISDFYKNLP